MLRLCIGERKPTCAIAHQTYLRILGSCEKFEQRNYSIGECHCLESLMAANKNKSNIAKILNDDVIDSPQIGLDL
jgi:hypothetical protein